MFGYAIITIFDTRGIDCESIFKKYLDLSFLDFYSYLSTLSICFNCHLYFDINPFDYDSKDNYIFKVRIDDYGV